MQVTSARYKYLFLGNPTFFYKMKKLHISPSTLCVHTLVRVAAQYFCSADLAGASTYNKS